jgi:hypothetical protein
MKQQHAAAIDDVRRQLAQKEAEQQRGQQSMTELSTKKETENARLNARLAEAVTTINNLEESVSILEQENADLRIMVDALTEKLRRLTTNIRNSVDLSTVRFSVDLSDADTESNFGWGEADEQLFSEVESVVAASPSALFTASPSALAAGSPAATSSNSPSHQSPASPLDSDKTPRQSTRRKAPRKRPPLPGSVPHTPTPQPTAAAAGSAAVKDDGGAGPQLRSPTGSVTPVPRPRTVGDVFTFAPPPPPGVTSLGRPVSEPAALGRDSGIGGDAGDSALPFVSVACASVPGWDVSKIGTRVNVLRYGEGTLRCVMMKPRVVVVTFFSCTHARTRARARTHTHTHTTHTRTRSAHTSSDPSASSVQL